LRKGNGGMKTRFKAVAAASLGLAVLAGCSHSAHVEVTVENRTGGPIRLLEVDYPSASFGADSLAAGAAMHYKIQLQDKGQIKVQYTTADNHQVQMAGPQLAQGQEGKFEIVLQPAGKADFKPDLKPIKIPESGRNPAKDQ
jgi:hypothetical protein